MVVLVEKNSGATTIYDLPRIIVEFICQLLIRGHSTTHHGTLCHSRDLRNFANTCNYFTNLIKNANLKVPHTVGQSKKSILPRVLVECNWKINKLCLLVDRRSFFLCLYFIEKHSDLFAKKLDKLEVVYQEDGPTAKYIRISAADFEGFCCSLRSLDRFIGPNTNVKVIFRAMDIVNVYATQVHYDWIINYVVLEKIDLLENIKSHQLSHCKTLWINLNNSGADSFFLHNKLRHLASLQTLEIYGMFIPHEAKVSNYRSLPTVSNLKLDYFRPFSLRILMDFMKAVFPNLKLLHLDLEVMRFFMDLGGINGLKLHLPKTCSIVSVHFSLLECLVDCTEIKCLKVTMHDFDYFYRRRRGVSVNMIELLRRIQSAFEILVIEADPIECKFLDFDFINDIMNRWNESLKVLSFHSAIFHEEYDIDQVKKEYASSLKSSNLELFVYGHCELINSCIDAEIERKVGELDSVHQWRIRPAFEDSTGSAWMDD